MDMQRALELVSDRYRSRNVLEPCSSRICHWVSLQGNPQRCFERMSGGPSWVGD